MGELGTINVSVGRWYAAHGFWGLRGTAMCHIDPMRG
jgi:hypothetical protein